MNQSDHGKIIIANQYEIHKKIGKGSFGDVYIGYDTQDNKLVAIKLEHQKHKVILSHEYSVYKAIEHGNNICIPRVYWFGKEGDYYVMVMQYLGNSIEYLFNLCNRKFSLKTVLMAGIQILDSLKLLHDNNFVHRDLKPDNFLIGINNMRKYIYLIDFGLAKKYKKDKIHIAEQTGKKLVGTARYASINSHRGTELSRRDDMESLGYILIYFLKGRLPWQSMDGRTRDEKYENIHKCKEETTIEELCRETPREIYYYMKYVRSLGFRDKPNYKYMRSLLTKIMISNRFQFDYCYDWTQKFQN